jgi:hypothetical protein
MAETIAPYIYSPLQPGEVRLLYGDTLDDKCTRWNLRTTQLEPSTTKQRHVSEFDALSYTWGDLTETFSFVCDTRELRIHRNLRDALPFLANRSSSRPIWIDAVCINQLDEAEKFTQV